MVTLKTITDLIGTGGTDHAFQWRLHKDGAWSEEAPGHYRVDDGQAGLDIQFLEPAAVALQAEFLPAELTATPCLAVSTTAPQAIFLSMLTPQLNGVPALQIEALNTTAPARAIRITGPQGQTRIGWSLGASTFDFDGVSTEAASAVVREDLALLVRGTSLVIDGQAWLSSDVPCNLARRDAGDRIALEAEAPYGETGGSTLISLGGLRPNAEYTLSTTGQTLPSDGQGILSLSLNLQARREVELVFGGTVESDGGELDGSESDAGETDAGETDAGETDAGRPDAGETDAGLGDGNAAGDESNGERLEGSCGCAAGHAPSIIWLLPMLMFLRKKKTLRRGRA